MSLADAHRRDHPEAYEPRAGKREWSVAHEYQHRARKAGRDRRKLEAAMLKHFGPHDPATEIELEVVIGLRWPLLQLLAERDGQNCYLCGRRRKLVELCVEASRSF
jgi:hypothetical protein